MRRKHSTANLTAMPTHKDLFVTVAAIAGALLLTSCSAGDDAEGSAEATLEPTTAPVTSDDSATEAEGDQGSADDSAQAGGLDLSQLGDLEGLDGLDLSDLEFPDLDVGDLDVGGDVEIPADFPADVPLIDGTLLTADHMGDSELSMYAVSFLTDGELSAVKAQAEGLLTDAGFTLDADSDFGLDGELDGYSMDSYIGFGDINSVLLTVMDMPGMDIVMVSYTVDTSTWDLDW